MLALHTNETNKILCQIVLEKISSDSEAERQAALLRFYIFEMELRNTDNESSILFLHILYK